MTLGVPGYLQTARIQDDTLRYEWDDWDDLPAVTTTDEELLARLPRVSQRAVLAFMCGTAEWIYHRLAKLCDDPAPSDYLEAAWALIVEVRYCGYGTGMWWQNYEAETESWVGPVKGPIGDGLERLEIACQQLALEGTDPVRRAGLIAALATYIMLDPAPYKRWCELVLDRFEALYARDPEDEMGDVVPRQAVNPEFDFHVEQTEALINQFLGSLDYRANKFLSSPEEMLESEELLMRFQGTPYVFDIELDRRTRHGWKPGEHHHEGEHDHEHE